MTNNSTNTFENFLTNSASEIYLSNFLINLILSGCFALLLQFVYTKYSNSITNRALFSKNFFLLSVTTTLIIAVIKSSLALSLGLVGALSVVRFRAAIKEPEELSFLFLVIAMGLGFGAGQRLVTIIAFCFISSVYIISKRTKLSNEYHHSTNLTLSSQDSNKFNSKDVINILKEYCNEIELIRFDSSDELIEFSFNTEFYNYEGLDEASSALKKLDDKIKITFLDNKLIV